MSPISFTNGQVQLIADGAAMLLPGQRASFLPRVASVLGTIEKPTDGRVLYAVRAVLAERGVMVGRQALQVRKQVVVR
jgi:hypothetical protein